MILPFFISNLKLNFNDWTFRILLIYLIFNLLIIPFSVNIQTSIFFYLLNLNFFIIYSSLWSIINNKARDFFLISLGLVVTVLSGISLYNTLIARYLNKEVDGASFMWVYYGHNHLSALLLVAIPITLLMIKLLRNKKNIRILLGGLLIFFTISLLLTFARASLLALCLSLSISGWRFKFFSNQKIYNAGVVLVWGIVLALLLNFFYFNTYQQNKSFFGFGSRSQEMTHGLINAVSHPFTGTGWGTYRFTKEKKQIFSTDFTHNFIIDSLSDTGLISTSLLLVFITVVIWRPIHKGNLPGNSKETAVAIALWIGIVSLLLNNLVDFDLQLLSVGLLFWIFLGLLNSYHQKHADQLEKNQ